MIPYCTFINPSQTLSKLVISKYLLMILYTTYLTGPYYKVLPIIVIITIQFYFFRYTYQKKNPNNFQLKVKLLSLCIRHYRSSSLCFIRGTTSQCIMGDHSSAHEGVVKSDCFRYVPNFTLSLNNGKKRPSRSESDRTSATVISGE